MKHWTFTSYTNAWSLRQGLKLLNIELYSHSPKTIFVKHTSILPEENDVLFFTEEASLLKYFNEKTKYHFLPNDIKVDLIDDKLNFAHFLETINEIPVPYSNFDRHKVSFPIFIKARHSWLHEKKLPRGFVCKNESEFQEILTKIEAGNLKNDCFFFQKLLLFPDVNNYSVSGFFDYANADKNVTIITSRVKSADLSFSSTASLVKTIPDPDNLKIRSHNILSKLNYSGPFELEFFFDTDENKYYVLELNPRFWLQHGIFVKYFDNIVLKNYLNYSPNPTKFSTEEIDSRKVLWVDTSSLFNPFFSQHTFNVLKEIFKHFLKRYKILFAPAFSTYFKYYWSLKILNK